MIGLTLASMIFMTAPTPPEYLLAPVVKEPSYIYEEPSTTLTIEYSSLEEPCHPSDDEVLFAPIINEPEWNDDEQCWMAIDEDGEEVRWVYWEDSEEDDSDDPNEPEELVDETEDFEEVIKDGD